MMSPVVVKKTFPIPQKKSWLVLVMITTLFIAACRSTPPVETAEISTNPFVVVTPPAAAVDGTTAVPAQLEPTLEIIPTATIATTTLSPTPTPTQPPRTLTIGSNTDTEQLILGKMLVLLLQEAGYNVVDRTGLGGTTAVRSALDQGDIDLSIEYTSNTLAIVHNLPTSAIPTSADRAHQLAQSLDAPRGLTWLNRLAFSNNYILVVSAETAAAGLVTLTDLATFVNEKGKALRFCSDTDFLARSQDGLAGVQNHYRFVLDENNIVLASSDQLFAELQAGNCDVAVGLSTDGKVEAWGLHPLLDDSSFFPTNTAAPVLRTATLDAYPELAELLSRLGVRLNSQTVRQLNAQVDLGADGEAQSGDEETAVSVAQTFLQQSGLLGNTPQVVIGSSEDALNKLLATMTMLLLSETNYDLAPLALITAPRDGYVSLQSSAIDLLWEYSATALRDFYRLPAANFPTTSREIYDEAAALGWQDGLLWLERSTVSQQQTVFVNPNSFTPTPGTLPDLATLVKAADAPPTLCVAPTFYHDPAGLVTLFDLYDFSIPDEAIVFVDDSNELYAAVGQELCQVGIGGKLNGRLGQWALETLADPLDFFPDDSLTPIIRQETAYTYPQIGERLAALTAVLDHDSVNTMLARTELGLDGQPNSGDEEALETVAELYLCNAGLLSNCTAIAAEQPTPNCRNLINNGTFETKAGWTLSADANYTTQQSHQGQTAVRLGSRQRDAQPNEITLSQPFTLPQDLTSATLTYWYYPASRDLVGGDQQTVTIYDGSFTAEQERLHDTTTNERAWIRQSHDLSAYSGQTIGLQFSVSTDGDGIPTLLLIDDVTLEICS